MITLDQVLKAYDYADNHSHRYLRGTTNWCAAVAWHLNQQEPTDFSLYGYATASGKLYASGMLAIANGEQSWVKVYVNKEDLK